MGARVQLSVRRLHAAIDAMIVTLGSVTRRVFIERSATFLSSLALSPRGRWSLRAPVSLRIGIAAPLSMPRHYRLGLELGLDEARHAATLFGGTIVDVPIATPQGIGGVLSAIIGAGDESATLAWTHRAAGSNTTYMNVSCTSDRLRRDDCSRAAFHVAPSDAMARDAVSAAKSSSTTRAESWDAALTRFGADTLNQRFLTRFREPMTPAAWNAWFAVKAIWESALRQKSGEPKQIAEYLAGDATQFDGHKGTPLSFRSWDHQLRQPLYLVGGGPPQQIPEIRGDESVREALDRLGGSARTPSCGATDE